VQALATLNNLQEKWPEQLRAKKLLLETYTLLNDWQAVIKLLTSIEKKNLYENDLIEAKKIGAYAGLLKESGNLNDEKKLNTLWQDIPRKLKHHHHLIEVYISARLKFDDTSDCEVLLKGTIKRQWDRKLVRLYGLVASEDPDKQLITAESWLSSYTHDPVLLLTLGRICVRNSLWSKAREYLQKSINIQESSDTFL
jgi:HemY protein